MILTIHVTGTAASAASADRDMLDHHLDHAAAGAAGYIVASAP